MAATNSRRDGLGGLSAADPAQPEMEGPSKTFPGPVACKQAPLCGSRTALQRDRCLPS
jgi:hypothetical protein